MSINNENNPNKLAFPQALAKDTDAFQSWVVEPTVGMDQDPTKRFRIVDAVHDLDSLDANVQARNRDLGHLVLDGNIYPEGFESTTTDLTLPPEYPQLGHLPNDLC